MLLRRISELPRVMADFIRLGGRVADDQKMGAYLVGGFVRDMLLGTENFDVDIVVEGDGVAFALELSRRLSLHALLHRRFGTATLTGLEGFKVDIASARKESYEKPAALPVVGAGTINDDTLRRDFTINAMAACINSAHFGKILDSHGGQEDLKKGTIRALHEKSFIDDPTRILRAVRFEQRFGFQIEKKTLLWLAQAVRGRLLHVVQKHRLRDELVLILKEERPLKHLRRLHDLCGLSFIAPHLCFQREWTARFEALDRCIRWFREHFLHRRHLEPHAAYLALLLFSLAPTQMRRALHDFAFQRRERARVLQLQETYPEVVRGLLKKNARPSDIYRALSCLSNEVLLASLAMARHPLVTKRIEDFLFLYKDRHIHVRGEDLALMGVKPGPRYRKILDAILYSVMDGEVRDREEELALAHRLAQGR